MTIENLEAHRKRMANEAIDAAADHFLVQEGLDLLAVFRQIRSDDARHAIIVLLRSIVETERLPKMADK